MPHHLKTLREHAAADLKPALEGQLSPAERIALYKRFLKIEEHRLLLHHRSGASGLSVARARASLIDVVIECIFTAAINSHQVKGLPIALVATGGYGRGTLNPRSDVDILFLLPRASTKLPQPLQEKLMKQQTLFIPALSKQALALSASCSQLVQASMTCW